MFANDPIGHIATDRRSAVCVASRLNETCHEGYKPLVVYFPRTWLLNEGWRMYGLLAFDEVPSTPKAVGAGAPREVMA
jgi:hypothetical protein